MTTARITAILLDGSKHEATGVFRALADNVAWERRFKVSFVSFQKEVAGSFTSDGKVNTEATMEALTTEREAFLPWRLLNREKAFTGDFDSFLDNVEAIEVEVFETEEGMPVDPTTDPAPSTISSQASL